MQNRLLVIAIKLPTVVIGTIIIQVIPEFTVKKHKFVCKMYIVT